MFEEKIINFFIQHLWDSILVGIIIVLVGLFHWKRSWQGVKKFSARQGMYGYQVFYADQKRQEGKKYQEDYGKILYSSKYDIQGKPDYIFKKNFGKKLVPVEIKSGLIGEEEYPHKGDMFQVAMYFLIIEDVYGVRPKYGRLVYRDYMFFIKNTARLRKEVQRTLKNMRQMLRDGKGEANNGYAHCRYCLCRGTVCEFCED